ncbi:MAG: hypothetical protein ABSH24_32905, partial [Bryobacteraceae bacterium]
EDALVERLVAAEFKMRSVRYMDAGLFHYQAETNPMPEQFNKAGRSNPLAWAFHGDSAYYNSFSKLMRYEGSLQREFSRALRDLSMLQADRRARLAESQAEAEAEAAETEPRQPDSPAENPKNEKTNRTQFPEASGAANGPFAPDSAENPHLNPPIPIIGGRPTS